MLLFYYFKYPTIDRIIPGVITGKPSRDQPSVVRPIKIPLSQLQSLIDSLGPTFFSTVLNVQLDDGLESFQCVPLALDYHPGILHTMSLSLYIYTCLYSLIVIYTVNSDNGTKKFYI